jgi:hypothetical protein
MNKRWKHARRAIGLVVAGSMVLAANAAAQEPETTAASSQTCSDPTLEQPFSALGDNRDYVLAPGGAFDDPTAHGWTLEGGAAVVETTDPFAFGDNNDSQSLALPPGASAISPTMCVDLHYPTMRFIGMQTAAKSAGLDVEVFYPNAPKAMQEWDRTSHLQAKSTDGWEVTRDVKVRPEWGGTTPGWRLVALRFTADTTGSWLIDDVFVDPRMK